MRRLTKKIDLQEFGSSYIISSAFINEIPNIFLDKDYVGEAPNKLGQLEDLLQSYNVEDLEELDKLLEMATTYEKLSKQLGCPLEVRCKITTDTTIYDTEGNSFEVEYIHDNNFTTIMNRGFGSMYEFDFTYNDYQKTWWLKADRSE